MSRTAVRLTSIFLRSVALFGALLLSAPLVAAADAPQVEPVAPPPVPLPARGFLTEPRFIARSIDVATRTLGDGTRSKSGFFLETSNMVTGAGWIAVGPGYRRWFGGDRAVVEASAGWSWRAFKMVQARAALTNLLRSRLALGAELRWQDLTQITYFGEGAGTIPGQRSEYRLTSRNVVGYATVRPRRWVSVTGGVGWLASPDLSSATGLLLRQPSFLHLDAAVVADTRDQRGHPSRGGVVRAAVVNFIDRDGGVFGFRRYEIEAARFQPLAGDRVVLALHSWMVASSVPDGHVIPFYLMPSLGGSTTLRAFPDYRFHDRHTVLAQAESRIALFAHVDAAVFVDAGNVAARLRDLKLARTSIGAGLRLHSGRSTLARLDVAYGREGWQVFFRTTDPFHLGRIMRRLAMVPFHP